MVRSVRNRSVTTDDSHMTERGDSLRLRDTFRRGVVPVNLVCPTCRGVLPLPDGFTGDVVRCGNCSGLIPIPKLPANETAATPMAFVESAVTARSCPRPKRATGNTKAMVFLIWG